MPRWVEPIGLLHGRAAFAAVAAGAALPLEGGAAAFTLVRLIEDGAIAGLMPAVETPEGWQEEVLALTRTPLPFAGLPDAASLGRPLVMGVLNVTPDSFSDGGRHLDPRAALMAADAMLEAGADMIDVGGESTRPGAPPVDAETEIARVLPVIREIAKNAPVSVDTRHAATMRAALDAGAEVVNDVTALRHDPGALGVVAEAGCSVVLMHMPGTDPATMQDRARYEDVALEVTRFLAARIAACEAAGIPRHRIAVDPGIGFGKTMDHNLELLDRLPILLGLGCPVLVGASRKRFIGTLSGAAAPRDRMAGSVGVAIAAASRGASMLRVHDVAETVAALRLWRASVAGAPQVPVEA
ncbi:dihydropteroate synthase [Muricoccus pecuniae]|uniref:dihydropteroate synthase n=1 Tax=Muricoccus pecuniae TaxID=693023 RepID=A0A840YJE6_9PROT|nr:dihydropteroate synthase [Roseomonas pecuniae]MBB5694832.1 dihydropteroate synthase [Roseomonas pecuniae]